MIVNPATGEGLPFVEVVNGVKHTWKEQAAAYRKDMDDHILYRVRFIETATKANGEIEHYTYWSRPFQDVKLALRHKRKHDKEHALHDPIISAKNTIGTQYQTESFLESTPLDWNVIS